MKLKDRLKDNYVTGVILAVVLLPLIYLLVEGGRTLYVNYTGDRYVYPPPAVQLISIIISTIIFRILMINLEKEKIGKGYYFVIAIVVFVYFFIFYKLRNN